MTSRDIERTAATSCDKRTLSPESQFSKPPWPVIDAERAIGWVEKKCEVTLEASQRAAVALALAKKLLVVELAVAILTTTHFAGDE